MEFFFNFSNRPYIIQNPEFFETPHLLVFREFVESNIQRMGELLKKADGNFCLNNLCPHVKTHKSLWITKLLKNAGIHFFKSTMNEVDMLINASVEKIFIAYPLLQQQARRLAKLKLDHTNIQFFVQISNKEHFEIFSEMSREFNINWHYFIDINIGMDRTGVTPKDVFGLFSAINKNSNFHFSGLHAYDGHVCQASLSERRKEAEKSMKCLLDVLYKFTENNVEVENTITGGTPSFMLDADFFSRQNVNTKLYFSPGTWIYSDSKSTELMPHFFDIAAVILAQVIDRPTRNSVTINIGHKRWGVDQGPIDSFSIKGLKAKSWNEEHTVLFEPKGVRLKVGDYVLVAPRHVCTTVNLWESFSIINQNGVIEVVNSPVDARNR